MRTSARRLVALVVIGGVGLAACGSDDSSEPTDDPAAEAVDDAAVATDLAADEGSSDDGSDDDAADDGAVGLENSGSAVVIFDDVTYEFAPTGDPYSCYVDGSSGILMATFDGLTDAGDVLYLDYDSDRSDTVDVNVETVNPLGAWYFGNGVGGTDVAQTTITSGDGQFSVSGEMTSAVPGDQSRTATITIECD